MNDQDAILAAIRACPDEDAPRLAYADWLEEHAAYLPNPANARTRAEFIRMQIESARQEQDEPVAQWLRHPNGERWFEEDTGIPMREIWSPEIFNFTQKSTGVPVLGFKRGFLDTITVADVWPYVGIVSEITGHIGRPPRMDAGAEREYMNVPDYTADDIRRVAPLWNDYIRSLGARLGRLAETGRVRHIAIVCDEVHDIDHPLGGTHFIPGAHGVLAGLTPDACAKIDSLTLRRYDFPQIYGPVIAGVAAFGQLKCLVFDDCRFAQGALDALLNSGNLAHTLIKVTDNCRFCPMTAFPMERLLEHNRLVREERSQRRAGHHLQRLEETRDDSGHRRR